MLSGVRAHLDVNVAGSEHVTRRPMIVDRCPKNSSPRGSTGVHGDVENPREKSEGWDDEEADEKTLCHYQDERRQTTHVAHRRRRTRRHILQVSQPV